MTDICEIIENGGDVHLKNNGSYEYECLDRYEGNDPGIILGVYKHNVDHGYRLIAHDRYGNVVHADGRATDRLSLGERSDLALVPEKRTFSVLVQRTTVERAWVEIEAVDEETAEADAVTYAEDNYRDSDWDEHAEPEFEAMQVKEGR